MSQAKRGSIIWKSDGTVVTFKGVPVPRVVISQRKTYHLTGATGSEKEAQRIANGYRRQFGGAIVRKLEPGNFGIYAGGKYGR